MNLGWELAACIQGWAPAGLLDTYEAERRPIGEAVLDWTRGQVALMRPDPMVGPLREVVRDLMAMREGMTEIVKKISGVMQQVEMEGTHRLPGRLVPDIFLGDGSTLRDAFRTGKFVLLDCSKDGRFVVAARPWAHRAALVHDASASLRPGTPGLLAWLDGVIIWGGTSNGASDCESLEKALLAWAGRNEQRSQRLGLCAG